MAIAEQAGRGSCYWVGFDKIIGLDISYLMRIIRSAMDAPVWTG